MDSYVLSLPNPCGHVITMNVSRQLNKLGKCADKQHWRTHPAALTAWLTAVQYITSQALLWACRWPTPASSPSHRPITCFELPLATEHALPSGHSAPQHTHEAHTRAAEGRPCMRSRIIDGQYGSTPVGPTMLHTTTIRRDKRTHNATNRLIR